MDAHRRLLLKGLAFSGIASLALRAPAQALASSGAAPGPVAANTGLWVLINDDAAGSAFLQGAMTVGGPQLKTQRIGRDLDFMLDFERRLRNGQEMRIVGLLDDASGTLVADLARSAGAAMPWLGRHTARAGSIRHQLLDTNFTGDWVIALQRSNLQTAEWAFGMGCRMAMPDAQTAMVPISRLANVVPDGSFVSFSIVGRGVA